MNRTPWVPYKIPPVVERESPNDVYALSFSDNAQAIPQTNPSKFLEWKKIDPFPEGTNLGDILYWNPLSGDDGEWVILSAPQGAGLKVLTINNGVLAWNNTEDCE
jgi:hypothetical protein